MRKGAKSQQCSRGRASRKWTPTTWLSAKGVASSAHHVDQDSSHLAHHDHVENGEAHVNEGDGGQKKFRNGDKIRTTQSGLDSECASEAPESLVAMESDSPAILLAEAVASGGGTTMCKGLAYASSERSRSFDDGRERVCRTGRCAVPSSAGCNPTCGLVSWTPSSGITRPAHAWWERRSRLRSALFFGSRCARTVSS